MLQQATELEKLKAEVREESINDKGAEAPGMLDEGEAKDFGWESNRGDENSEDLPWPEENESKD